MRFAETAVVKCVVCCLCTSAFVRAVKRIPETSGSAAHSDDIPACLRHCHHNLVCGVAYMLLLVSIVMLP